MVLMKYLGTEPPSPGFPQEISVAHGGHGDGGPPDALSDTFNASTAEHLAVTASLEYSYQGTSGEPQQDQKPQHPQEIQ